MIMAHTQGGAAEFRCQFPASRFRLPATLPAGRSVKSYPKMLISHSFLVSKKGFSGQKHVFSLLAGTDDALGISAWRRKQARACCSVDDRLGIDAVGTVKISDVAGLSKAVDAQRDDRVAGDGAEPR